MEAPAERRFLAVDAMRGVAALSVLAFHLLRSSAQAGVLDGLLPGPVKGISDYGRDGVAIFFVISGFVIAYTTRSLGARVRDGARFSLRRQVRLDPPYYLVMAGVLVVGLSEHLVPGLVTTHFTPREVVLNMFYLQGITGTPSILAVAWTLCLEVQFYLVVTALIIVSGTLVSGRRGSGHRARPGFVRIAALALGAVSLALPYLGSDGGPWFIGSWWMFALGMVMCWAMIGTLSVRTAAVIAGVVLGWCIAVEVVPPSSPMDPWRSYWLAWGTAVVLLALVVRHQLTWRPPRVLLFFGSISYSLYLVHLPVIDTVMAAGFKWTGDSQPGALCFYVLGAAISIGVAYGLRRFVERPSMLWSGRLKTARLRRPIPRPTPSSG